jgi:hypothetical protein
MAIDVASWLQQLGLERYEPAFRDNEVDGDVLPDLTAEDLIAIGARRAAPVPKPRSGRRNGALIEQRNWLLLPSLTDRLSQLANVTVTIAAGGENMPRRRIGAVPMTPAERQARRRNQLRRDHHPPPAAPARRTRRAPNAGRPR